MHVSLMARLYAHVANIHLNIAMLVGLQNIGGVLILVVVHIYILETFVAILLFVISTMQIRVLSSNTKKGEIERAFPA